MNVIENVLNKTWAPSEAEGREVPVPKTEDDCVVSNQLVRTFRVLIVDASKECYSWEFGDFPQKKLIGNTTSPDRGGIVKTLDTCYTSALQM